MVNESESFVAFCAECGGLLGVCVDSLEAKKETARYVGDWTFTNIVPPSVISGSA